jgi:hypothetical protein
MGVSLSYRRITQKEYSNLLAEPRAAEQFFGSTLMSEEEIAEYFDELRQDSRHLDVGKEWETAALVLTGLMPDVQSLVRGGDETPFDCTYGNVRYLSPEAVGVRASELRAITDGQIQDRIANLHEYDEEELQYSSTIVEQLRTFFTDAANDADVVLVSFN